MKNVRPTPHPLTPQKPARRRITLLFLVLAALCAATSATFTNLPAAHAVEDPALEFFTITTPHFYVHYYSGLEDLARRTAILAEEAHETLVPLLSWVPRGRTHINVIDKLDTANGSARVFMRNEITIYGMAPGPESVLGNYDDWLRILVYHEYVHILHLDTNPGLSQFVNLFIGKQLHPNHVLPRWYTEGIATYYESARTGTGRINSSLFQMWLRAAALEDKFFTLGQTSSLPVQWPSGSAAYLYGGFFIDYIARHHGEDFIRDFNHIYGRRVIPFSLNDTARTITGLDFDQLWNAWTAEALANSLAQQTAVRAQGETELTLITTRGGRNGNPIIRPGHDTITFYRADPFTTQAFASIAADDIPPKNEKQTSEKTTQKIKNLFPVLSASSPAAWSPDGETLYYTRATITRGVYAYQDIFAWHAPTNTTRQLTSAERALDPAISPDGKQIAYVRNRQGTTELVMRAFDDFQTVHVLWSGLQHEWQSDEHWQQLSMPAFTPDGRALVFSRWGLETRQRDLWLIDLDKSSQTPRQLTNSASNEIDPHFGPDGLLYFSSDITGIFNVFAMDVATQQTWQISNVVNGVFTPRLSPDARWIYVTTYTSQGFEIARFSNLQTLPQSEQHSTLTALESPNRIHYPAPTTKFDLTPEPYQAWRWLLPLTFMPDFAVLSSGLGLSAVVTGEDPVGHSTYTFSAGWTLTSDLLERNASAGLSYAYGGWPVNVNLTARIANYPRAQGFVAESRNIPFTERQYVGRISLSYPIRLVTDTLSVSTAFEAEHTSTAHRPRVTHEPADIRPQFPVQGWYNKLSFSLGYSNLKRFAQSISTESGISASTSVSIQNEALGSLQDLITFSYGFDAYYPNPFFLRHVLALQLRGAITSTAVGPERQFSIGGQSPQDVLTSIIFQEPRFGFPLRGYPPGIMRGNQYQVLSLQYRFPILDLDHGFSTLPVFFRQLKASVFADTGTAYNGYWADVSYKTGIGAELQLDTILGYHIGNTLRLGYAHGLNEDAISEWYLFYGGGF